MDRYNQNILYSSNELKEEKEYWLKKLEGIEAFTSFQLSKDKYDDNNFTSKLKSYEIPIEIIEKIMLISKQSKYGAFIIFLCGLMCLLGKYTEKNTDYNDILIAMPPFSNENSSKSVNSFLPLRFLLDENSSFIESIIKLKNILLEVDKYKSIPINMVLEDLGFTSHEHGKPNIIVLEESIHKSCSILDIGSDINFSFDIGYDSCKLNVEYDASKYNETNINSIVNHLITFYQSALQNPNSKLYQIHILSDEEKTLILEDFNNTTESIDSKETFISLFQQQVQKIPSNIALIDDKKCLTYIDLDKKSNELAWVLKKKELGTESIISIAVKRSTDLIVGIIAILKAGYAFLPIDPDFPQERIKYMLENSKSKLLITQKNLMNEDYFSGEIVHTDKEDIYINDGLDIENNIMQTDLAYVLYTSGSTGQPKGVMIEHKSIVNLIRGVSRKIQFEKGKSILALTTVSFDIFILETLLPLSIGMKVVIANEKEQKNPQLIAKLINDNNLDMLQITPSRLQFLINDDELVSSLYKVKELMIGGEALPNIFYNKVKTLPNVKIYNMYGPTESTVWSTIKDLREDNNLNIGKPIDNTYVYILNKHMKLLPVGIAGELYIGGLGLARGYHNNDDLTNERFVDNPFRAGEKIYRTGDLARWLYDGNIEFLGRVDQQIKLRGYRIELEEIESVLSKYESIQEAVVIPKEGENEEKSLVAYLVSNDGIDSSDIRTFLEKKLPEYMIPTYFISIDAIPLTPNGKINKKALLDIKPTYLIEEYLAPRNEIEHSLVDVWKDVLGISTVGIRDNFFKIGGDSVKVIQILARLNKLKMALEFEDVFEYRTIEKISKHIRFESEELTQLYVEGDIPLLPFHHWLNSLNNDKKGYYPNHIMLRIKEKIDENIIDIICQKLTEHHDALRAVCKIDNGELSIYNRGLEAELYNLSTYDFTQNENYFNDINDIIYELNNNSQVFNGFLINLFKTDEYDYLLFAANSMLVDKTSWGILYEDITTIYNQIKNNNEVSLGSKTISFKEWAERVQEYSKTNELLAEANYWKAIEDEGLSSLDKKFNSNDILHVYLSEDDSEKLLYQVNEVYNTKIDDLLITALGQTIEQNMDIDKMIIDIRSSNRDEVLEGVDIRRTVGCFESIYPFLLDLPVSKNLSYQIKHIKERIRRVPNNGIGYSILNYTLEEENHNNFMFNINTEICFSYLGEFGCDFDSSNNGFNVENTGALYEQFPEEPYSIDIKSLILDKRLLISINYDKNEYNKDIISTMAEGFKKNLKKIIVHCLGKEEKEPTPSDYNVYDISIDEFQNIYDMYDGRIEKVYSLSPLQEGILLHSIVNKSSSAYFQQLSFVINGDFSLEYLEKSFNVLLERYELFRTVFAYGQINNSKQIVLEKRTARIAFEDISSMEEHEMLEYIEHVKEDDKRKGFDLTFDILMRVKVFKLSKDSYTIIWSHHHIIMDGWSTNVVLSEFFSIYNSLKDGNEYKLPEVYPFSNFIKWLDKQDRTKALEYWEEYLSGYEQQISLPKNRLSKLDKKHPHRELVFSLGVELTKKLNDIAVSHQITTSNIFNAIWSVLLASYNNTKDVVFGSVVSGRPPQLEGIEQMIGLFINTIPVRVNMNEDSLSFKALLENLQKDAVNNTKNSYFSLAEIQSKAELKEKLLEHIVIYLNLPEQETGEGEEQSADFSVDGFEMFEQTMYNLSVKVFPGNNLTVKMMYNPTVYDEGLFENLESHFIGILKQVVYDIDAPINKISILTENEKKRVLCDFNNTRYEYDKNKTIVEIFQEQVRLTPDRVAVVFDNKAITYRKLNIMANKLARSLREKGITRESIVAVLMDRTPELIVAILGILKAGAAYLPIDAKYPHERVEYILRDSKAHILLSNIYLSDDLDFCVDILDINDKKLYETHGSNISNINICSDTACIIYTSGTTGNPKGVILNHQGIINHVYTKIRVLEINEDNIMCHNLSMNFVASIWLVFAPLFTGAKFMMYNENIVHNAFNLFKKVDKDKVDILELIPSFLGAYMELIKSRDSFRLELEYLKKIALTGEEVKRQLVNDFYSEYKEIELFNAYGQSECSDDTLHYKIPYNLKTTVVPIGKPSNNTHVYILNKFGQLQAPGLEGELYIAGDGLAVGYLDRLELTLERFIPNPFGQGEKMYKTGDSVRWLSDGNVEFLGRVDHQVKIRGYRIELGEIEAQLTNIYGVKEAVVVPITKEDSKNLYAYLVCDYDIEKVQIKKILSSKLPFYMIPLEYIKLDKIPLNTNGKVDYKSLPLPESSVGYDDNSNTSLEDDFANDSLEMRLIKILGEVVNIDDVDSKTVLDSLLVDIGINSLTFIKMIVVIESVIGIEFEEDELDYTRFPNLNSLADYIRKRQDEVICNA